jgi:glycosyltransferase involved in cell wall biosynthesis
MSSPRFSIVTCFHNSSPRLDCYFAALQRLDLSDQRTEFVFVDNASTDDTLTLLHQHASALTAPVLIATEPRPGLMFARRKAIPLTHGEFVLFLDDDNEPAPDYVAQLHRLIDAFPRAAFYCGNSLPPQDYGFSTDMVNGAAVVAIRSEYGEREFDLRRAHDPYGPWGAGLCCRRDAVAAACDAWEHSAQKLVGRTGTKLSGGEDHWIIHYVCRSNPRIVFSDKLVLTHRVDPRRLKRRYLLRANYQLGRDWPAHLDAFKALRAELPDSYPVGGAVWLLAFYTTPRRVAGFLRRRDFTSAAALAWHAGLLVTLVGRRLSNDVAGTSVHARVH